MKPLFVQFLFKYQFIGILLMLAITLVVGCSNETSSNQEETGSEVQQGTDQERTISHLAGETVVVGEPKRIAVLDYRLADTLLALGVTPYAMTTYLGEPNLPYIEDAPLDKVIALGDTVNIEALLEAEPDLILARKSEEQIYDQLSKIAPTVILDVPDDWREGFKEVAQILERVEEADLWLTTYDQKAESIKAEIAEHIHPDETFLYLRVMPKEIRVHGPDHNLSATLFHDLELTPVPAIEGLGKVETISLEAIIGYDADHIFIENGGPDAVGDLEAEKNLEDLMESSIWHAMKAVQHDQVYMMPPWVISDYPNIKDQSLDLILEHLTNQ